MYKDIKVTNKKRRSKAQSELEKLPILDAVLTFPGYLYSRLHSLYIVLGIIIDMAVSVFSESKSKLVSKMFWGRGSLYRSSFHLIMSSITVLAITTGLASQILAVGSGQESLNTSFSQGPTDDFLQQGSSLQAVLEVDPFEPAVNIFKHTVQRGDSLAGIADKYNVSIDTIRWANSNLISPFSQEIQSGWELRIPEMNGVLKKVQSGENLDDIVKKYGGHPIDIIELNGLQGPDYTLAAGAELFIPNGEVPVQVVPAVVDIPRGVFSNPLSHPGCAGYTYSRGFTGYHRGVDLAKGSGCPIRAIATGKVEYAGWSPLAGFNVRIDHGGGITSIYMHGNGTFWVNAGDRVQQGQEIMYMGTTGNSTGVHLHVELRKDGYAVNPAGFIPY